MQTQPLLSAWSMLPPVCSIAPRLCVLSWRHISPWAGPGGQGAGCKSTRALCLGTQAMLDPAMLPAHPQTARVLFGHSSPLSVG